MSSGLLLVVALFVSLIAIAPIIGYAWARPHVDSRSPLAGLLLFPALWTSTWSLVVWLSPLGRIGTWSPMTGIEDYLWVAPIFGQPGLDYMTALWAIVIAEYSGKWLMGRNDEEVVPDGALPNVDLLVSIDHEVADSEFTQRADALCGPKRHSNPAHFLAGLLILAILPSYWAPILPLPTHAQNTTELTVGCVHPYVTSPGIPPTLDQYLAETRTQASRAKIILWPEGAVYFRSDEERKVAFSRVKSIADHQKAWIGVAYQQAFLNANGTTLGERVRGVNALAIFGPDAEPITYVKRRLVPLVESFSLEASTGPPPRYAVSIPKPNSRPKSDKHSWPRTIPVTAGICLDMSAPLALSVPVNSSVGDLGRPALILAPARTWHPEIGKAMFQHASMRAAEQGSSVLWCDGGEGGVSGIGGLAAQGLGLVGGIGQVGGGASWIQTIGIPFPYNAYDFRPTWYARWGDITVVFLAWAALTIGPASSPVCAVGNLVVCRLKRLVRGRIKQTQPDERTGLLIDA